MPTILHQLSYTHAPSAGLTPVDITDAELALMAAPELLYWWRADTGFSAFGWDCRKTGNRLVAERSGLPTEQTLAAYNDKASLLFSDSTQLWDNGENLMPVGGDMSMLAVGRAGVEDGAFLVGGAKSGEDPCKLVHQSQVAANGAIRASFNDDGSTVGNHSVVAAAEYYYADGPNLIIGSHSPTGDTKQALTVNNVTATGNPSLAGTANAASELHVGGVNVYGSAISGGLTGDLAEIMIWNAALHVRTDLRALVQGYVNARYAIW